VEAAWKPPASPPQPAAPQRAVRASSARYGLIAVLLAPAGRLRHPGPAHDGNLTRLGDNLVAGLSNGAIWALIAIGYTLVYGIIELINFAHGDVFMIGSFVSSGCSATLGLTLATARLGAVFGLLVTLIVAMLGCGSLNVMIERVAYRPLRNAPKLAPLITAVGFSFILQNVGLLWLGGSQQASRPDPRAARRFTIFGVTIDARRRARDRRHDPAAAPADDFIAAPPRQGDARHRAGPRGRAADGHQRRHDDLADVPARRHAGRRGRPDLRALPDDDLVLPGLPGRPDRLHRGGHGRHRQPPGAVLGGLIIGCIQQISDNRIGTEWTPAIVFAYLILIMVFKPQGLLGEETREAG
jgi:branched-chain amino acid transport system permease protein